MQLSRWHHYPVVHFTSQLPVFTGSRGPAMVGTTYWNGRSPDHPSVYDGDRLQCLTTGKTVFPKLSHLAQDSVALVYGEEHFIGSPPSGSHELLQTGSPLDMLKWKLSPKNFQNIKFPTGSPVNRSVCKSSLQPTPSFCQLEARSSADSNRCPHIDLVRSSTC